jgi:hypothetical protein
LKPNLKPQFVMAALLSLASLGMLQGCASPQIDPAVADASNPETVKAFEAKLSAVARTLPSTPGYKRIPLDSKPEQEWFTTQAFLLWDQKKSKQDFVNEGEQRFPGYRASFEAVADHLLR